MSQVEIAGVDVNNISRFLTFEQFVAALKSNARRIRIFYDIETKPAPIDVIKDYYDESEIELPKHPGEFDPLKVKYGNTKDEVKRAAKLEEERQKHAFSVQNYDIECVVAKSEAWEKFVASATLHPETCEVAGIGYGIAIGEETEVYLDIDADEREMLRRFWFFVNIVKSKTGKLISFNGNHFDLPMLTHRSWVRDLDVIYLMTKYRKFEDFCEDALDYWKLGGGWGTSMKLDKLAKLLGVHRKLEGVTGDMWHRLIKEDPEKARDYLESDILSLAGVARRLRMV